MVGDHNTLYAQYFKGETSLICLEGMGLLSPWMFHTECGGQTLLMLSWNILLSALLLDVRMKGKKSVHCTPHPKNEHRHHTQKDHTI